MIRLLNKKQKIKKKLKKNKIDLKVSIEKKNHLIKEMKALENGNKKTEINNNKVVMNEIHEKKEKKLANYVNNINDEKKQIIALINDFKAIKEKINNDCELFNLLKPIINEFLTNSFIKKEKRTIDSKHVNSNTFVNNQSQNNDLLSKEEQIIKTLEDYIKEKKQNTEKHKSILFILENFSNDNESRIEYDSNVITHQLTTNAQAVMKIGFRYRHFARKKTYVLTFTVYL